MLGGMRRKAVAVLGCVLRALVLAAWGGTPEPAPAPTPDIETTVQAPRVPPNLNLPGRPLTP